MKDSVFVDSFAWIAAINNRVREDINSFVKTQPDVSIGHKEVAIAV
ncbi:MAG: hypothetical protein HY757_10465 [Nitrospirae bacterium]|nr:hypothetical protein [Nitrospirota bacterium]